MSRKMVSVIGAGRCEDTTEGRKLYKTSVELGRRLAQAGYGIVCGGLLGVMEGVCKGASEAGGLTVGILPVDDREQANQWVEIPIATGLGQMRNMLVVMNGDTVVAVGGGYGTLSEVALAKKSGKTVIAIGDMGRIEGVVKADDPEHVCTLLKDMNY